jgi:hypothetical protein
MIQSPVLVGRDTYLTLVEARLAGAAAGAGQLLFVAGEAGIGKTRLLGSAAGLRAQALTTPTDMIDRGIRRCVWSRSFITMKMTRPWGDHAEIRELLHLLKRDMGADDQRPRRPDRGPAAGAGFGGRVA